MESEHVLDRHPGVHVLQPDDFPHDERGAKRQHERERDFDDDEGVTNASVSAAHRRVTTRLLRDGLHVHASGGERRRKTEQHRRREAGQQEKPEGPPVERDFVRAGNLCRTERDQKIGAPSRDGHADQTAGKRQQKALDEKLPDQAQAVRAECGARRDFADPHGHPRQEQVRNIGARGREDQADGGKQHPKRSTHRPQHVVGQRDEPDADAGSRRRLCFEPRRDRAQFGGRGVNRDTWLQPGRDVAASLPQLSGRRPQRRERDPQIGPGFRQRARQAGGRAVRKLKRIRHDAEDRERPAVERDRLSRKRGIAVEAAPPEAGADHRHVLRIVGPDRPAGERLDAEHREEARRRPRPR